MLLLLHRQIPHEPCIPANFQQRLLLLRARQQAVPRHTRTVTTDTDIPRRQHTRTRRNRHPACIDIPNFPSRRSLPMTPPQDGIRCYRTSPPVRSSTGARRRSISTAGTSSTKSSGKKAISSPSHPADASARTSRACGRSPPRTRQGWLPRAAVGPAELRRLGRPVLRAERIAHARRDVVRS